MQPSHNNRANGPFGIMDVDNDLVHIKQENYRYALNIRNGKGAIEGAATNVKGNALVEFDMPLGQNKCIGTYEDKRCSTVIYFVWNSSNQHLILRYYPEKRTVANPYGTIERLAQGSILRFNTEWLITHAALVDNTYLYWTDSYSEKGFIEGNPPRKINIEKSNVTNRGLCYEFHVRQADSFFSDITTDGLTVRIIATNGVSTTSTIIDNIPLQSLIGDPDAFLSLIQTIINSQFSTYAEAELCGCKLEIKTKTVNGLTSTIQILQDYGGFPPPGAKLEFMLVPIDHYPVFYSGSFLQYILEEQHIDLIKYPPLCPPTSEYEYFDSGQNNVNRDPFQFIVRYWYDDFEKSAWSPISIIPLITSSQGNIIESLNSILVDFTEDRINTPGTRSILRKVEIAFREGNDGVFKSAIILDTCEIGFQRNVWRFVNDRMYSVVPSDDIVADGTTQNLKLFDSVPLLSGTLETYSDQDGSSRLFLGANLENYDEVECPEVDYEIVEDPENACLVTIRGTVNLYTLSTELADPINQITLDNSDVGFRPQNYDQENGGISGFVVYLAGTPYYGIARRNTAAEGAGGTDGVFQIRDVPKGKYIIRVAGYRCRFNDDLGRTYNINNGLTYQRTSAPTYEVAGSLTNFPFDRSERELDLTGFAGGLFDLDVQPGYGDIKIINPIGAGQSIFEFYLFDSGVVPIDPLTGQNPPDEEVTKLIKAATSVERQRFISGPTGIPTPPPFIDSDPQFFKYPNGLITDHNSHCFVVLKLGGTFTGGYTMYLEVYDTCNSTPNDRRVFNWNFFNDPVTAEGLYVGPVDYSGWEKYEDLQQSPSFGVPAPTVLTYGSLPTHLMQPDQEAFIYILEKEFFDNNKTIINGSIKDQIGDGVSNINTQYSRNNKGQETNTQGDFSILAYCPYNVILRFDDIIIHNYAADICYDILISDINPLNLGPFCTVYNFSNPFDAGVQILTLIGGLVQDGRYFKSGERYRTGLAYSDRAGRISLVSEVRDLLSIDFHTQTGTFSKKNVQWSISHQPPEWATHYRFVRSRGTLYRRYIQWIIGDVRYVIINAPDDTPQDTTFDTKLATHILIEVSPTIDETNAETNPILWFFKEVGDVGYEAEPKDRIRLIADELGTIVTTGEVLDYEIVGRIIENDKYYIVIEDPNINLEITKSSLVEFYSPKTNEEVFFYETGDCYEIIDAGTPSRRHSGPIQDQIVGSQPAQGVFISGDTYWRRRDFVVRDSTTNYGRLLENDSISYVFPSKAEDIGRVIPLDPDFGQKFYSNQIRFSGLFRPNSKVNELSSFIASDVNGIDLQFGIIKKLIRSGDLLLAICEFKIQPIYVGKDDVLDLTGRSQLGRSDRILNLANELKENLGTMNPESVVEHQGFIYGWDVYQGIMWRYASNGLYPISDYGQKTFFNSRGKQLLPIDRKLARVFGGVEREFDTYLTTFVVDGQAITSEDGFNTISFDENKNGFNTFMSFVPEYYGMVGDLMVSFKDGRLWLHEVDDVPTDNFYGTQYTSRFQFVFNDMPRAMKILYNMQHQATSLWYCPDIEIPASSQYPLGMRSRIKANRWDDPEGVFTADFLRDINDPNPDFASITPISQKEATALLRGRPLRGHFALITMELNEPNNYSILRRIDVEHSLSNDTKV